jgi:gluconolactonase
MEIDVVDPSFMRLIELNPPLDCVVHGITFGEGPVWDRREGYLRFVDIIGSRIWKYKPGVGHEVLIEPTGHANGMTLDKQGRLIVAGWSRRSIWRVERDGSIVTLVTHYEGMKINTPNDIVVHSSGATYWTDSPNGLGFGGMGPDDAQQYIDKHGVYRLSDDGKDVTRVIDDDLYFNGLAFSPDESRLYVNNSGDVQHIRVFDVRSDGSIGPGRLFYKPGGDEPGGVDGMKVDVEGNLYTTGPGGIHVLDPKGRLLGRLKVPAHCTNMAWGDDDWRSLYITTIGAVYRTRVKIPGIAVW